MASLKPLRTWAAAAVAAAVVAGSLARSRVGLAELFLKRKAELVLVQEAGLELEGSPAAHRRLHRRRHPAAPSTRPSRPRTLSPLDQSLRRAVHQISSVRSVRVRGWRDGHKSHAVAREMLAVAGLTHAGCWRDVLACCCFRSLPR